MSLANTFRAHVKMGEVIKAGFAKHACVVPALSLHLFGRKASIQTVVSLEEQVAALEKRIKTFDALQVVTRSEFDTKFNSMKALIDKSFKDGKRAAIKKA